MGYKKLVSTTKQENVCRNKTGTMSSEPLGVTLHDLSEADRRIAGGVQVEV